MKTERYLDLQTGQTGAYDASQAAVFPQLERLPDNVSVLRGGDATLTDGVDHVFLSAGGASVGGDPLIIRGGGA